MKTTTFLFALTILPLTSFSQKVIEPGSSDIKTSRIKLETTEFQEYIVQDTFWTPRDYLVLKMQNNGTQITTDASYYDSIGVFFHRTTAFNASTMKPLSIKSEGTSSNSDIQFGAQISGSYLNKKNNTKSIISASPRKPYFDYYNIQQLIAALPLDVGYKANFNLYLDNETLKNSDYLVDYSIDQVKSYTFYSSKTGNHDCWLVNLKELLTGAYYYFVVDKKDHRIWQTEQSLGNGKWSIYRNQEIDYQPIKAKFNVNQMEAQINNGNSAIIGRAFAKDKQGKRFYGLVNTSKKQFPPKGTEIILFPNSEYYKEWKAVNKKIRKAKKMPEVPLDKNFIYCIKRTKVYDDEGHFEFTNLRPGDYVIMGSFDFQNSYRYSYVSGYTDYYNGYGYVGSSTNYGSARQYYSDEANLEKEVTISADGDKKEIDLK